MATATAPAEPKNYGSSFDLAKKSIDIVKSKWQLFAFVHVFVLLSAVTAVFNTDQEDETSFNEFSSQLSGTGSIVELQALIGTTLVVALLLGVVVFFFRVMQTSLELRAARGAKADTNELVNDGKSYFFPLLGLFILYGLAVIAGLILLIVPGVILFYRLVFAPYIMLDKKLGVMDSLKASWDMTKGRPGAVWGAIGVTFLVGIAASVLEIVPLIGTILGAILVIACSLVIPQRYVQIAKDVK